MGSATPSPQVQRLLCRLTAVLCTMLTLSAALVFAIFSRNNTLLFLVPAVGSTCLLCVLLLNEPLQETLSRVSWPYFGALTFLGLVLYIMWLGTLRSPHARVHAELLLVIGAFVVVFLRARRPEYLLACAIVSGMGIMLFGYNVRGIHKDCDGRRNLVKWGHESSMQYFFPHGPPFSNPGGRLRPNVDCPMEGGGGEPFVTVGYQTNSMGFRNREELLMPKPLDEYRILSLGDSFSIGYGIDQAGFFGPVVQGTLRSFFRDDRYSVWNAEVSDPAYGLHYLKTQGLQFGPSIVLYGLSVNDLFQTYLATLEGSIFSWNADRGLEPNFPLVVNYGGPEGGPRHWRNTPTGA